MRAVFPDRLEQGRAKTGNYATTAADGGYGWFEVQGPCGELLRIMASAGDDPRSGGWEHVSVSIKRRVPNWREMCFVKDLFWGEDEVVVQYHPARSEYVNNHPHCLHLWRNDKVPIPTPPAIMVGVRDRENMSPEEAEAVKRWEEIGSR